MHKPILALGITISAAAVLLFFASGTPESYRVSVPQEFLLVFDQHGFTVQRGGETGETPIFSCLLGDQIYIRSDDSTLGPIQASGWFEIWENLSDLSSRRVYRIGFSEWVQKSRWNWTVPKSGYYSMRIVNEDTKYTIFFHVGGYSIHAEREIFEWRTRYPYRDFEGVSGILLLAGIGLSVASFLKKE